jgi:hypothetical protein
VAAGTTGGAGRRPCLWWAETRRASSRRRFWTALRSCEEERRLPAHAGITAATMSMKSTLATSSLRYDGAPSGTLDTPSGSVLTGSVMDRYAPIYYPSGHLT